MTYKETQTHSETIFTGRVISVTRDEISLANGQTAQREVVHHNGGAAVIALTDDEQIYLVRQYRYAVGQTLIEIPAGKLEKGEDPFEAAKRELAEEAGVIASDYLPLGYIIPTCGYCTEKIWLYAAKNLQATSQNLDEDEFLDVERVPLSQAVEMVLNGEIPDSKTAMAILKLSALRAQGAF